MTEKHSFDPFAGGELLRVSPTTAPQQEIIAAAKMSDEANTAFNEAIALQIDGSIDVDLLERCFNTLAERHEILRTTFSPAGDELCLQKPKNVVFEYEDLQGEDDSKQQKVIQTLLKNIAISPMNLEEGPLLFVYLKRREESLYELIVATHHLVCDGWSFGIMLKELGELYNNNGSASSLGESLSFYDYAEEQSATSVKNVDADFWLDSFEQLPLSLDLPLDKTRPATRSFSAARLDYSMDTSLVEQLPTAASALKSSKVNYVLAAYFSLLYRLTGNEDIVVGLPLAGQAAFNRLNLFGHLVHLIPIRLQLSGETTFAELVHMVKQEVIRASEHPNFTFGQLLEKFTVDRSRVPIISTIFNIDQPAPPIQLGTATASVSSVPRAAESFEIFLNIVPSAKELLIEATYSKALFSDDTISSWLTALESILRTAITDHNIELNDLQLASEPPKLVREFNQTGKELVFKDVISAFLYQQKQNPDAVAVISEDTPLTYTELDDSSSQLAQHLYNNGVREGSIVGICCQRSSNLLQSTLAILKLGAAYLPLDPDFPEDRLVYMLEDSGAVAVIEDNLAPEGVKDAEIFHLNLEDMDAPSSIDVALPVLQAKDDRLAYTIYTSGSTGEPKGVNIQNIAMINFLESMVETPGFSNKDRLLAVTTLSFDISVLELFLPIIVGGTTIIANSEDYTDGEKLSALLLQHQITVMQATPSTWRLLLASSWGKNSSAAQKPLKALCGGEPLPQSLVNELLPMVSELWNMYGPTETTVWSTCKRIDFSDAFIAIGPPIANTQIYILDSNLKSLPISVPGELCIGGTGVTLGYRNRPELNADRFVEHADFGRIYRTGDFAKIHPSGEIQHLGRMDDQVKLRGYRIELGEIETALASCEGIKQAAVYLWTLSDEDIRIVACCVPEQEGHFETIRLRKQLRSVLPSYMVPQYFLSIEALPLTPNGKIDRRSLPRPEITESAILSTGLLHTDSEKTIAGIWSDLLKITGNISREDNFFELGGHSLLALEAIRRIEIATKVRLELAQIVTERLVAIAEKVSDSETASVNKTSGPKPLPHSVTRQLSAEQKRLLQRQLDFPNNTSNNLPAAWLFDGELDLDAFQNSVKRVFERQTALRTIVVKKEENYSLNLLHISDVDFLRVEDYSKKTDAMEEAVKDSNLLASKPFDVVNTFLCRTTLYQISPMSNLLVFIPHQLVFDGWSFDIFLSELEAFYEAALEQRTASLDLLSFQFRDYADWSSKSLPDLSVLNYHKRVIQKYSGQDSFINAAKPKGCCGRRNVKLQKDALSSMELFCENHQFRLHEIIFAALAQAYGDFIDKKEFSICLPVTGRYTPEVIGLVGCFVSTLPAEINLSYDNFVSNVDEIASQLRIFHENQEISFAQLATNTPFENQAFPSILSLSFAYQDIRNRPVTLADLQITQVNIDRKHTEFPLEFWARIEDDGVLLVIDYDEGQVDTELIDSILTIATETLGNLDAATIEAARQKNGTDKPPQKKSLWRRLFQ